MKKTIELIATLLTILAATIAIFQFAGIVDYTIVLKYPIHSIAIVLGVIVFSVIIHFFRQESPDTPPPAFPSPTNQVDLCRLPLPATSLVGRSQELGQLTRALNSPKKYLAHVYAPGGVGKSALLFRWLQKMQPDYHHVAKVFAWSFENQGLSESQTSSLPFFQTALPFFGFTGTLPKDEVDRGRALANCLRAQSFILILDGLEPLQYPTTDRYEGGLKDVAIKELFTAVYRNGLGASPSLIVITSRQPLVELEKWEADYYVSLELPMLSPVEGGQLLQQLGVRGKPEELATVNAEWGGHALSLVLLGRLVKYKFYGRVDRRHELPKASFSLWQTEVGVPVSAEERQLRTQMYRLLRFYAGRYWQPDGVEIEGSLLEVLSLFDRPMTLPEREVLTDKAECAKPLVELDDVGWQRLETTLERAGLLLRSPDQPRRQWDCHPLIREYFRQRFADRHQQQYQQAHRVLFEYYQSVPTQHCPDTLEELEPLYWAVVHGCLAGEYWKALDEVYWERIQRVKREEKGRIKSVEGYSLYKLGAYSQDLTALTAFFPQGWTQSVQQGLSEADQAWLLAEVSFCLMSLGRLAEAIKPGQVSAEIYVRQEVWGNASRSFRNIIAMQLSLGYLTEAVPVVQQAIDYAKKIDIDYAKKYGEWYEQVANHAYLATILHRQGQLAEAAESFATAEQIQRRNNPKFPLLYSVPGFQYCAFLLDQARNKEAYKKVLKMGEYGLKIGIDSNWLSDIALYHLTLARAHLKLQHLQEAATYFDQAIAGIRKAGNIDFLPEFLLDRANYSLQQGDLDLAQRDLQEAGEIIERGGMKLYAVDYHLAVIRQQLWKTPADVTRAREHYERAQALIEETGYHLRDGALAELRERLGGE